MSAGGWISFLLMAQLALATALSVTGDLAVTKLVNTVRVPGQCQFNGTGLVFNLSNGPEDFSVTPQKWRVVRPRTTGSADKPWKWWHGGQFPAK